MSINYKCRHCKETIGSLVASAIDQTTLGLGILTDQEMKEMIQHRQNGDIDIQTICESCEGSLEHHPEYHELDHFIQ